MKTQRSIGATFPLENPPFHSVYSAYSVVGPFQKLRQAPVPSQDSEPRIQDFCFPLPILHSAICTPHSPNPHGTALFCTVPRTQIFSSGLNPSHRQSKIAAPFGVHPLGCLHL